MVVALATCVGVLALGSVLPYVVPLWERLTDTANPFDAGKVAVSTEGYALMKETVAECRGHFFRGVFPFSGHEVKRKESLN